MTAPPFLPGCRLESECVYLFIHLTPWTHFKG